MSAVRAASRISEEPILVAAGITKKFGGLAAVDGVDLTIRRGEILGVIGPNGAGKTTFVNCMTGLDKPTAGSIVFDGQDITKTPSYRIGHLGMARTFQVVKPLRQLTVRENVAMGAMFGGVGYAAWLGGEWFLAIIGLISWLMTWWVGILTLLRG